MKTVNSTRTIMLAFILTIITLTLFGCISRTVTIAPPNDIDFKKYHKVRTEFTDQVHWDYSKSGMAIFKGFLNGCLGGLGYEIVDENEDMLIKITITQYTAGSAAARFWVGFGAGRAALRYDAEIYDATGQLITKFNGGKMYHGGELDEATIFKNKDELKQMMALRATNQIVEYLQSNGKSPTVQTDDDQQG